MVRIVLKSCMFQYKYVETFQKRELFMFVDMLWELRPTMHPPIAITRRLGPSKDYILITWLLFGHIILSIVRPKLI